MPTPPPALSTRLGTVRSFPVRATSSSARSARRSSFSPAACRRRTCSLQRSSAKPSEDNLDPEALPAWIVEDDPYGELRYDGAPLAPIGSRPGASDRTITISSLSKVLAPGMRIGPRAPETILRPLVIAKQAADLHTSTVDQAAARASLEAADLDAHIDGLRDEYRRRRDAPLDGLGAALPAGSSFNRPDSGMFVWVRLPAGCNAVGLLRAALEHGVAFVRGHPFFAQDADRRTLRLSFTAHVPAEIGEGRARLAQAEASSP